MITTLSSREFNQDTGKAKKASEAGPVFITDRGKPAHVLMTFSDYRRALGQRQNILDLLDMGEMGNIDFEPGKLQGLTKPVGDSL
jgi:prevent-host-death family protein